MELLRLKDLLKEKNVSGKDLAESVNVSPNTISRIAKGVSFPSGDLLKKIADELDVDIRELFLPTKKSSSYEPIYRLMDGKYIEIGSLNLKK